MATTPRGIEFPTTGDTITPLANRFASLATTADAAITAAQGKVIGTNAERLALTAPALREGLSFYATDTNREWFYDGTNWLQSTGGCFLVYPSSVSAGSVQADGTIVPTGNGASIAFVGVFSPRFRHYRVLHSINKSNTANQGTRVNLRIGASDYTTPRYYFQSSAFSGTQSGLSSATAQGSWNGSGVASTGYINGEMLFSNPASTDAVKFFSSRTVSAPNIGTGLVDGFLSEVNDTAFDGFSFGYKDAGGGLLTTSSTFKIYAYA